MSTTAPSPPSSANSHPPTTTTTSSTTTIRLLPIDPSTLHTLAHVGYHAFFDFSISVSQPPEFPSVKSYHDVLLAELDKQETFALMAVREGEGSERSATYVEGVGEVLGSVLMDCTAGEVAAIGPISVASTAQKTGVGRKLMLACLAEAQRRRVCSVRLCNIVANASAFALYHSIGFRAVEYMMHCKGLIHTQHSAQIAADMQRNGITVRTMTEADLPHCEQLHVAACSFSRIGSLSYKYRAQRALQKQAGEDPDEPPRCCFVAVDAVGAVVGYNDGYDVDSHWLGTTEEVIVALYHRMGEELRAAGSSVADILVLTRQHGALLDRLARLGVRILRQVCLMATGEYVPPHRHVYCPSIMW